MNTIHYTLKNEYLSINLKKTILRYGLAITSNIKFL